MDGTWGWIQDPPKDQTLGTVLFQDGAAQQSWMVTCAFGPSLGPQEPCPVVWWTRVCSGLRLPGATHGGWPGRVHTVIT